MSPIADTPITLPLSVDNLIKLLDELYPHRCPDISTPERKIWMDAGARGVVDFLLRLKEERDSEE